MSLSVAGVVIKPLQKKVGGDFQPHKHPTDFLSNVPEISSASLRDQQINIKKNNTSYICGLHRGQICVRNIYNS